MGGTPTQSVGVTLYTTLIPNDLFQSPNPPVFCTISALRSCAGFISSVAQHLNRKFPGELGGAVCYVWDRNITYIYIHIDIMISIYIMTSIYTVILLRKI